MKAKQFVQFFAWFCRVLSLHLSQDKFVETGNIWLFFFFVIEDGFITFKVWRHVDV